MQQAIVIWMDKTTALPSVIGPYESDLVWDDAKLLEKQAYKVQVCQVTAPDQVKILEETSTERR